ncbi:MAG: hypothetical protein EOP45_21185 [Sphingobacteriaceae bacterium]|nr:MAG: hypothetical protein EOP45_21185 [Sphingobacteriaceae bacterium]
MDPVFFNSNEIHENLNPCVNPEWKDTNTISVNKNLPLKSKRGRKSADDRIWSQLKSEIFGQDIKTICAFSIHMNYEDFRMKVKSIKEVSNRLKAAYKQYSKNMGESKYR